MIALILESTLCWKITLTLFHVSWLGVLIGMCAAFVNRVLRNRPARWRYRANLLFLLLFSASFAASFGVATNALTEISKIPHSKTVAAVVVELEVSPTRESPLASPPEAVATINQSLQLEESPDYVSAVTVEPSSSVAPRFSVWNEFCLGSRIVSPYITVIYAIGVLLMLIRTANSVSVTHRLRTARQAVEDGIILNFLKIQSQKLGLRVLPTIATCEEVAVPLVVGLFRPMILLPAAMLTGLTPEQFEAVLTHELAHLQRRDHVVIVLQRVLEAILFFHPVTWYLSRRIQHERECCCDDLVVSLGTNRFVYANSLLRVAEMRLTCSPTQVRSTSLAADGHRPSSLRRRILNILSPQSDERIRVTTWPIVACAMFAIVSTAIAASAFVSPSPRKATEEQTKANVAELISPQTNSDNSVDAQLAIVGEAVMRELRRDDLDYLSNATRIKLVSQMLQRLQQRVSRPINDADLEQVLLAIQRFFKDRSELWPTRKDAFMTQFALLEWRIWVGMDPLVLSDEEKNRRESQRVWFRDFIQSRYKDVTPHLVDVEIYGEPKTVTMDEFELLRYGELLSDPTYPFLSFPFSDEQFEEVKTSLLTRPNRGLAFMQVYAEHFDRQFREVQRKWRLPGDGGSAIWGTGSELVQGFADDLIAESEIPNGVAGDSAANTEQMIALSESDKSSPSVEKPARYVPPKDALLKLLGVEHDREAVRKNVSGLQHTTMTPVPEMEWEPVSLEEVYEAVIRGMEANFSRIGTWSGECQEVIFDRYDRGQMEKSHLVRFEWDVQTSKGGAVKTRSVKLEIDNADDEPIFREAATFYTPFFFGRQNVLHWKRMEVYVQHFRRNAVPDSRRFVLAHRAKDQSSGLWKLERVYTGIAKKLLVTQVISTLQGNNVVQETSVEVDSNGKTDACDDLLQSYSEAQGVFVPSERLERQFECETGLLRRVHLQKITRSVVNQPLQPLPGLVRDASEPSSLFFTTDGEGDSHFFRDETP